MSLCRNEPLEVSMSKLRVQPTGLFGIRPESKAAVNMFDLSAYNRVIIETLRGQPKPAAPRTFFPTVVLVPTEDAIVRRFARRVMSEGDQALLSRDYTSQNIVWYQIHSDAYTVVFRLHFTLRETRHHSFIVLGLVNKEQNVWRLLLQTDVIDGVAQPTFVEEFDAPIRPTYSTVQTALDLFYTVKTRREPEQKVTKAIVHTVSRDHFLAQVIETMQAAERAQRITLTPVQIVFRDRVADDFRTRTKRGIMLLDEMGLGKTMSVISAITAHPGFLEQHASFRVLWVVPRSTMTNVIAELGLMGLADVVQEYKSNMLELSVDDLQVHIWLITPDMLHNLHKAGKDERLTLVPPVLQDETLLATRDFSDVQLTNVFEEERQQTFQEEQQQQQKLEEKEDVSDAMAANHFDFFFGHEWDILAVDEADRIFAGAIKPVSRTQQYSLSFEWGHIRPSSRYIYQVKRDYVILMTGTPMKNSILDVAALAMMVNNDSATAFPRFWTDMESWTSAHFNAVRAICIRRERAHDLITFEKTETVAPLTPKQVERELEIIRSSNPEGRPVAALTVSIQSVTALRLNCLTADYKDGSLGEHDAVTRVAEALGKLVEEKQFMTDKVVVFCEFVRILEAIKLRLITYIKASKMPVDERIAYADSLKQATIFSGEESTARRDEIVARSRDAVDNVGDCVMFVSQRAGGIGLNFQFASHVICVGEWFQMQSENQAFDRVRRLGQLRHVVMNKFVSAGGFGIHAWMKRISRKKEKVSNAWLSILVNPDKVAWTEEEKAAIRELSHGLGLKARDAMLPTADVVLERDPPSDLVVTAAVESLLTAVDAQFATDFPYWPLDLMQSYYPNRSIHE